MLRLRITLFGCPEGQLPPPSIGDSTPWKWQTPGVAILEEEIFLLEGAIRDAVRQFAETIRRVSAEMSYERCELTMEIVYAHAVASGCTDWEQVSAWQAFQELGFAVAPMASTVEAKLTNDGPATVMHEALDPVPFRFFAAANEEQVEFGFASHNGPLLSDVAEGPFVDSLLDLLGVETWSTGGEYRVIGPVPLEALRSATDDDDWIVRLINARCAQPLERTGELRAA